MSPPLRIYHLGIEGSQGCDDRVPGGHISYVARIRETHLRKRPKNETDFILILPEQLGYLALWHSDTKELEVDFRIAGKCHNCEHPGRAYRRRLIDSDATKRYGNFCDREIIDPEPYSEIGHMRLLGISQGTQRVKIEPG
ncbi:uncharacterized protein N7487_002113 [Penicillium crustosum]|uniref:uncharacterized protein n=1 Tax=Penicillium crustosum TaxID=36656 RepID=UPI0023A6A5F6|nr:uncharacterized protein N7487_002113 [Penicillium crustosum]KAJ5418563.1 hypothetical protein N7487_002113 [Penicillium crustosum]